MRPTRHRVLAALLALTALAPAGSADAAGPLAIGRESQRDVMVTIYNGNLGLVKDVREVRLPAGMTEVQFMDVAAQIDPTTVHLRSLTDPAGLRILEQNYEYDLLSSEKLLEKYVGKKVRLYQGNGTYQEATLLSTERPGLRHQRPDPHGPPRPGRAARRCPRTWSSKPTLCGCCATRRPAPQRVEASYLTGGITWKADYVMVINAADDRADLTGWVTIDNKSGATYRRRRAQARGGRRQPGPRRPDAAGRWRWRRRSAAAAPASPRLRLGGLLRVPPLHARRPHDDQGQPDQAAHAHVRRRRARPQGAASTTAPRDYYRSQYGTPMSQPEGRACSSS